MRFVVRFGVLAGVAMAAFSAGAGSEDDIKYRQSVMKAAGGHMGAIMAILQQKVPHQGDLVIHAQALADVSGMAGHVFPAGSGDGKTEAKPEIWSKPKEFQAKMDDFKAGASALLAAVKSGDQQALGAAARQTGGSCKGCHDDFQKE